MPDGITAQQRQQYINRKILNLPSPSINEPFKIASGLVNFIAQAQTAREIIKSHPEIMVGKTVPLIGRIPVVADAQLFVKTYGDKTDPKSLAQIAFWGTLMPDIVFQLTKAESGAQFSDAEYLRRRALFPTPGLTPEAAVKKLDALIQQRKSVLKSNYQLIKSLNSSAADAIIQSGLAVDPVSEASNFWIGMTGLSSDPMAAANFKQQVQYNDQQLKTSLSQKDPNIYDTGRSGIYQSKQGPLGIQAVPQFGPAPQPPAPGPVAPTSPAASIPQPVGPVRPVQQQPQSIDDLYKTGF